MRQLITHNQAKSPITEAFRTLRTNLQFSKAGGILNIIMYTSTGPGEGKSTTAANTAVVMAQSGKRVIIIDCDLRKPVQHKIFNLPKSGLSNVLAEDRPVKELLQETDIPNLQVLTSGPIPPNPSELLGSPKMLQMINELKSEADCLVLDAPPVIAVTDACVLASQVDGIVLVISARMVRPEMARRAKELLLNANGHILGVVMNRVEIEKENAYYYYYYGNEHEKQQALSKA